MVDGLVLVGEKVRLREKRVSDAALDYQWQTDAELTALDAAPVTRMSFQQFLAEYIRELRFPSPSRRRFAIETLEGRHIGNCTYYSIDLRKGEAEIGILIGDRDYWGRGYGTSAVCTLVEYIFTQTTLTRVYLKTLEDNTRAQRCFANCGFAPYGYLKSEGYRFLLMEQSRAGWVTRSGGSAAT